MPVVPVQTRLAPPPPPFAPVPAPASVAPTPPAPSAALDLRIDSLVLHGFSNVDGRRVGAAFEEELARLLSGSSSPHSEYTTGSSSLAATASFASAPLPAKLAPGRPELTGRDAARALHARLRA